MTERRHTSKSTARSRARTASGYLAAGAVVGLALAHSKVWSQPALVGPPPLPLQTPSPLPTPFKPYQLPAPSPPPQTLVEVDREVRIKARSMRYSGDTIVAEGEVEIVSGDTRVVADRLELDQASRDAVASGNVIFTRGANSVATDRLTYNLDTKHAAMQGAVGRGRDFAFQGQQLTSELFFWGETLEWDTEKLTLKKGAITSCDLPVGQQHFRITADEVVLIPNDKITVKKARVFFDDKQRLGLSNLVFSLRPDQQSRRTFFPQFGYNNLDGLFVKTNFQYRAGEYDYGTLHLDLFQRTGVGAGIGNYYKLGGRGEGQFYYYSQNSPIAGTGRYQLNNRVNYKFPGGTNVTWFFDTNQFGVQGGEAPVNVTSALSASRSGPNHSLLFNTTLSSISLFGQSNINIGYNLLYHLRLHDNLTNFLVVDYTSASTAINSTFRLWFLERLTHVGPLFDTELNHEVTTGNAQFFVNREPELVLRGRTYTVFGIPMRLSLGVGNFSEQPTAIRTTRTDFQAVVPDLEFRLNEGGRLYAGGGLRQNFYENGESRYVTAARAGVIQQMGEHFAARLDYTYQEPNGFTPLLSDFVDTYKNLSAGFEFSNRDHFRATVTGGYDFRTNLAQSVMGRMRFNLSENHGIALGANYDPNSNTLQAVDGQLRLKLSPELSFQYYGLYDNFNQRLTYNDFAFTRETHDFYTHLVFRSVQNEIWLQLSMKNVPYTTPVIGVNPASLIQPGGVIQSLPNLNPIQTRP